MKAILTKKLTSLSLLLLLFAAFPLNAFASSGPDIAVSNLHAAKIAPDDRGLWHYQKSPAYALPGEMEALSATLYVPEKSALGNLSFTISSDSLDLKQAFAFLLIDNGTSISAKPLAIKSNSAGQLSFSLSLEAAMRNKSTQNHLYISAPRLTSGGSLTLRMQRDLPSSFDANTVVSLGEYDVKKQGPGAASVEAAAGLASLPRPDVVYCVEKDGQEVIRILLEKGSVMGLAIADGSVVVGVEYSLDRKVYINTLTQKSVLSREELTDIFTSLDCSFMRAPDENKWLKSQPSLGLTRSIDF